ncbi:MAG: carbonic anhydrase [Myxococcales bacterium]|nr:carbonic anhydrase [Myxococcales bacterium]MCB9627899.1 carbonic anhydrase [Sandaracinaceae bacterium]
MYDRIFTANRAWVAKMLAEDEDFFEDLATDQAPDYLYIGCADSRVPANSIMGLKPGEVFVHRNIANCVPNTDINSHSVIQYAVEALKVKHIIVCGHYGCGGVQAAMQPKDLGLINGWLREIRDVFRLHRAELLDIADETERFKRLVELNVQEQCIHVIKTACVQKSFAATGYPIVHGWVFDLHDGLLRDLNIPFETILDEIREIYRLT